MGRDFGKWEDAIRSRDSISGEATRQYHACRTSSPVPACQSLADPYLQYLPTANYPQVYAPLCQLHDNLLLHQERPVGGRWEALKDAQKAKGNDQRVQAAAEEISNIQSDERAPRAGTEAGWVWTPWAGLSQEEQRKVWGLVEDFHDGGWSPPV